MALIDFTQLIETITGLECASHKLLILVGITGAGKTAILRQISTTLGWPAVNLGRDTSERFLSMTARQRKLKAEEVIGDVLDSVQHQKLCLDNTEILFDPALALNPVLLLQNFSRNRLVVATWNGSFDDGVLSYGYDGHPEHFRQSVGGFPVVTIADRNLHLYLTP